ncbi:MAG: hypothetical protein ACFCGT_02840 [Sandaracinaceae bacterium]
MREEPHEDDLRPARPEDEDDKSDRRAIRPQLPWAWMIGIAVLFLALVFSYAHRETRRAEELREELLAAHRSSLGDLAGRYMAFRGRLEVKVMEAAAAGAPETWVLPRLNLGGLRSADGLYLRIAASDAQDPDAVLDAVLTMGQDAITRCLGVSPMSLSGLYRQGDFLTPSWVEAVRTESDYNRLRVFEDQLRGHLRVDVPVVATTLQASWFLLVIERGESRATAPVDVYLWDLRRDQLLLKARIQGRGVLLPVQVAMPGVTPGARAPAAGAESPGAADCSIAAQVRALTGHEAIELESAEALLEAARQEAPTEAPAEGQEPTDDAHGDPRGEAGHAVPSP